MSKGKKKLNINPNTKKAFTLAEALITLVIIGVIAALTIGGKAIGKATAINKSTYIS